jgi:ubiquinone/menaquinone biosynthesis C-methylase UbiE
MNKKTVLHVGCGTMPIEPYFPAQEWMETRLDIDPAVQPDIVCSITNMTPVSDESYDAICSLHNLEHLYAHEVYLTLKEFHRVLKPNGIAYVVLPDIQTVAEEIVKGNLEGFLYHSPAGPISPIDVIWGHRDSIQAGNHYMVHKTGFTAQTLGQKFIDVGFQQVKVTRRRNNFELLAIAEK